MIHVSAFLDFKSKEIRKFGTARLLGVVSGGVVSGGVVGRAEAPETHEIKALVMNSAPNFIEFRPKLAKLENMRFCQTLKKSGFCRSGWAG